MTSKYLARILVGTFRFILPVVLLIGGVFGAITLIRMKPDVPRTEREARPTLVETVVPTVQDETIMLTAYGSVEPFRTTVIRPQVSGVVFEQNPKLLRGGVLDEGELLVAIDPRDYIATVEQEKAAVARASFELKLEEGRQIVAKREWKLLDESIEKNPLSEELALRRPHLAEKTAALAAAEARLTKAEVDLERTKLIAPFPSLVLEETTDEGQLLLSQNPIATLVCTDEFHIELSIPLSQLADIRFRGPDGEPGSKAWVGRELGTDEKEHVGFVLQRIGNIDRTGRMARVLVAVRDPLHLKEDASVEGLSPLLIGEYVRVRIEGPEIRGAVRISRRALREGSRVWVKDRDSRLAIRRVEVRWGDDDSVLLRNSFEEGDEIITSALAAAVPGLLLESVDERLPAADDTESTDR